MGGVQRERTGLCNTIPRLCLWEWSRQGARLGCPFKQNELPESVQWDIERKSFSSFYITGWGWGVFVCGFSHKYIQPEKHRGENSLPRTPQQKREVLGTLREQSCPRIHTYGRFYVPSAIDVSKCSLEDVINPLVCLRPEVRDWGWGARNTPLIIYFRTLDLLPD